MNKRLRGVLTLLESDTLQQLLFHFFEVNQRRPRFEALMAGMVNATEECMECYAVSAEQKAIHRFEASLQDVNHPLIHVLRNGTAATWQSLLRGVRIDETRLRQFVYELPGECGLHVRPLFDNDLAACGVLAVFSREPDLYRKSDSIFSLSCELVQYQIKKIRELEKLRRHLRQIREVFQAQRQKQQQLDDLIAELSSERRRTLPVMGRDFSETDDLDQALEKFESEVLVQRMRQYDADRKRVAASLNLSLRALNYKLIKHGLDE